MEIQQQLSQELGIKLEYVKNIIDLINEGNTIPFIARYRKEMHGNCGDELLRALEERYNYIQRLNERKQEIINAISGQEKLTEELSKSIENAKTLAELDDIYAPFKQKKKTRASIAKEKGLEDLSNIIFAQENSVDLEELAKPFINEELDLKSSNDVLQGASDIIAEKISENLSLKKFLILLVFRQGYIVSKNIVDDNATYANYFNFKEAIKSIVDHRILALNRGEKEKVLSVKLEFDRKLAINFLSGKIIKETSAYKEFLLQSIEDAFDRLIFPSIERYIRAELTDRANRGAISNFSINLKNLLLQAPIKGHITMGLDPGYKNGCKVAIVDENGNVLDTAVVYLTMGEEAKKKSLNLLYSLIKKHNVEHIAIGNGTASRETELATVELIKLFEHNKPSYVIVNEAGASVYSAGKLASQEFPNYDVNIRSAISIARRLQDPLAELVKIDPKSIGVGQYQHDMPKKELSSALENVVEDCVNLVGVDINTASSELLTYISGLSSSISKNIVEYRAENGSFKERKELLKVKGLGPKAYLQCAGFLRIPGGKNILDNTSVHPESYKVVQEMLNILNLSIDNIGENRKDFIDKLNSIDTKSLSDKLDIGEMTLADIINELKKPGRDPRDELPKPILKSDVLKIEDIKVGMVLTGTVRNVIDFGAFVDIGVHEDGLVHITEMSNKYIKHPSQVLSIGDVVDVKVIDIDLKRKRISLSIKQL